MNAVSKRYFASDMLLERLVVGVIANNRSPAQGFTKFCMGSGFATFRAVPFVPDEVPA